MKLLSDETLVETYLKTMEFQSEFDPAFIEMLYNEVCKRKLDHLLLPSYAKID